MGLAARIQSAGDLPTPRKQLGPDLVLLAVTALIVTIGIIMVTSAGYIIATGRFGDGFYYTKKQGMALIIGLVAMYTLSRVDPSVWKRASPYLLVGGVGLLLMVFVPFIGAELGGSHRWMKLPFGYYLQPSEFVKYALVMFLARSLARKEDSLKDFVNGFLPNVLLMGLVVSLIVIQPDFGTGVMLLTVCFLMLFVAGVRLVHLLGVVAILTPFLIHVAMSAQYRLSRLRTFWDPWSDPLNAGWQVIQSLVAFGCGGIWGVGIGKGIQKLGYLPQPHTDFIFAVIGEELGLVGVAAIILLFYVLICRGLVVAIRAADRFQSYLAFGITCLIGLQAMVNMAVAMGMLPTKGLPLPLVSLGGTSLMANLAGLGILMAIARNGEPKTEEERK